MGASGRAFRYLPKKLSKSEQVGLIADLREIIGQAPLFQPEMPRTGKPFSVRMSNCGTLGWVSDKERGYRYQATHPATGTAWPPMPRILLDLWRDVTTYRALPEACLINFYNTGTKMGSHQDRDELDLAAPVLSVSLGDDATFHVGGLRRADPKERLRLSSGDVLVLEGDSRLAFHGIDRIHSGTSALLSSGGRINLTLRRVSKP